jgi:hypothetical protein
MNERSLGEKHDEDAGDWRGGLYRLALRRMDYKE